MVTSSSLGTTSSSHNLYSQTSFSTQISTTSTSSISSLPSFNVSNPTSFTRENDRVKRKKIDVDFEEREKEWIRTYGKECWVKNMNVEAKGLFEAYKKQTEFNGFIRDGEEMRKYWKGWSKGKKPKED
jgi:hypothetical protein